MLSLEEELAIMMFRKDGELDRFLQTERWTDSLKTKTRLS